MARLGSIFLLAPSVIFAPWPSLLSFLIFGIGALAASGQDTKGNQIQLDDDLYNAALAHARTSMSSVGDFIEEGIVERLQNREVEALYEVAKSMNDAGDKVSSVLIWHTLADDGSEGEDYDAYDEEEGYDYEGHAPSAEALGFSYYEVDKPRSLHYFLMATSKKGKPHQAAMFNAGRLYLELNDPTGALAYIRACANLDKEHPMRARPQLSIKCREAYETLSVQLMENIDPFIDELSDMFLYADLDDFPEPETKEFGVWHGAMEHLEKYAEFARKSGSGDEAISNMSAGERSKGVYHLEAATEVLAGLKQSYSHKLSRLQDALLGRMIKRIMDLDAMLDAGDDEL